MIGGAKLQRGENISLTCSRSQHHDVAQPGNLARFQATEHVEPVERRQIDAEEDHRRLDFGCGAGESRNGRLTIRVAGDPHAPTLHCVLEQRHEGRIVVDDRDIDASRHGAETF